MLKYLFGILGAIAAAFAWLKSSETKKMLEFKQRSEAQAIQVTLVNIQDGQILQLPVLLRRRECTRAEVLGRLGMLPLTKAKIKDGQKRFIIKYLNKPDFLQQINEIQNKDSKIELRIECDKDEFNQFEI